jgi:hypothetical protein
MRGSRLVVVQLGYVVTDLERAVMEWVARGAGPFFRRDVGVDDAVHRGTPGPFHVITAHGQLGDLQVELVTHPGDGRSVFRDVFAPGEEGLHHISSYVDDLDAALAAFAAAGHETAMTGRAAYGLRFAFVDTVAALGHMWELYEEYPASRAFYAMIADAAKDWDGSEPFRT